MEPHHRLHFPDKKTGGEACSLLCPRMPGLPSSLAPPPLPGPLTLMGRPPDTPVKFQ